MEIEVPLEFWFNKDPRLVMPAISFGKFYIHALVGRAYNDVINLMSEHKIYVKSDEEIKLIEKDDKTVMFHTETRILYTTLDENNNICVLNSDDLL